MKRRSNNQPRRPGPPQVCHVCSGQGFIDGFSTDGHPPPTVDCDRCEGVGWIVGPPIRPATPAELTAPMLNLRHARRV